MLILYPNVCNTFVIFFEFCLPFWVAVEMLSAYNNVDFMENPSVNVETIAIENGIIKIERVPGKSRCKTGPFCR
jgi:hypothetical protein